jgi:hypothetical protein
LGITIVFAITVAKRVCSNKVIHVKEISISDAKQKSIQPKEKT